MDHTITIIKPDEITIDLEMQRIGAHKTGISIMAPKAQFKIIKVKDLTVTQANIIKQDMLSFGGEAATAHGTIDHSIKTTDILIFGTELQIRNLISKLKLQYFGLKELAKKLEEAMVNYDNEPKPIKMNGKVFNFSKRTYIMGILNVTPDSFSDGGKFINADDAVEHAKQMVNDGADIIDIGGESTRPGARPVNANEEMKRVIPVIRMLSKQTKAVISIDTTKAKVAEAAIKAGASMINDVSALRSDSKMARIAGKYKVPIVLMHMLGDPRNMQKNPRYRDLIPDIICYLQNSITLAIKGGVSREKIIVDPGFGFGKLVEHNLEILRDLKALRVLGCPILIGTSRKSTIGKVLGLPPDQRIEGTAATVAAAIANGANIVRVHDIQEMSRVVKMCDSIYKGIGGLLK